jgi:uncharacterized protein (TIGR02246 family)
MRRASVCLAVLFWIFQCPMTEAASNQDVESVREVIAGLMKSWNMHDMHAFADLFAEDASFVNVNGSWLKTRVEIEESHKVVHSSIFKNSRAEITPAKIRFPKPDVAIVQARWQITGDSRNSEARDYVMTLILRKQLDQWRIVAAQNGSTEDRSTLGFANLRPGDVAPIPAPGAPSSPPTAEERARLVISAFDNAWNHRDASTIARLFAPKSDLVDTSARWVQGNREIASHILRLQVPGLKNPALTSGIERFTLLHPDIAFAQLRWKLETSGTSAMQIQGMGLRVLQRLGSSWQMVAYEDTIIRASAR